jgi:hypothetical protein
MPVSMFPCRRSRIVCSEASQLVGARSLLNPSNADTFMNFREIVVLVSEGWSLRNENQPTDKWAAPGGQAL